MITDKQGLEEALINSYAIEKGAREFYKYASLNVDKKEVKDIFDKLHNWENEHMDYLGYLYNALLENKDMLGFEDFSDKLSVEDTEWNIPLDESIRIFEEKDIKTVEDAVKLALEVEAKAYAFYKELADKTSGTNVHVIFSEMMGQEKKHMELINKLK